MNIYFIILICIYALNIGINLAKDREQKDGEYNFVVSLIASIIGILLLYLVIKKGF